MPPPSTSSHPLPLFPTPPAKRLGRTSHNYRKVSRETKEKPGGKKTGRARAAWHGGWQETRGDRGKKKHPWPVSFSPRRGVKKVTKKKNESTAERGRERGDGGRGGWKRKNNARRAVRTFVRETRSTLRENGNGRMKERKEKRKEVRRAGTRNCGSAPFVVP